MKIYMKFPIENLNLSLHYLVRIKVKFFIFKSTKKRTNFITRNNTFSEKTLNHINYCYERISENWSCTVWRRLVALVHRINKISLKLTYLKIELFTIVISLLKLELLKKIAVHRSRSNDFHCNVSITEFFFWETNWNFLPKLRLESLTEPRNHSPIDWATDVGWITE